MNKSDRDGTLATAKEALDAQNYESVKNLVTPLANAGDAEAQFILGYLYFTECDYPPSVSYEWLKRAAEQGHADSCYHLAGFPTSAKFTPGLSDSERVNLLIRAGELGSVRAQRDLGAFYATGDWAGPKSEVEAIKWYTKAAQVGNSDAQYNLAFMFLKGEGVPQNSVEGIAWLRKAAEQGHDQANRLLADIYRTGLFGVNKDSDQAQYWETASLQKAR